MSDREPENTPAQDLHRILFQAMQDHSVDDCLHVLSTSVAQIIVACAPDAERQARWIAQFEQSTRDALRQLRTAIAAARATKGGRADG